MLDTLETIRLKLTGAVTLNTVTAWSLGKAIEHGVYPYGAIYSIGSNTTKNFKDGSTIHEVADEYIQVSIWHTNTTTLNTLELALDAVLDGVEATLDGGSKSVGILREGKVAFLEDETDTDGKRVYQIAHTYKVTVDR